MDLTPKARPLYSELTKIQGRREQWQQSSNIAFVFRKWFHLHLDSSLLVTCIFEFPFFLQWETKCNRNVDFVYSTPITTRKQFLLRMIFFFFLNEEQKYQYLYQNTTSAKQGKAFYKKYFILLPHKFNKYLHHISHSHSYTQSYNFFILKISTWELILFLVDQ